MKESTVKKKIIGVIVIVAIIALAIIGFKVAKTFWGGGKITGEIVLEEIQKCAELTTAKNFVKGTVKFEDGEIPLINKKSFKMFYTAVVTTGVNLKDIDCKVSGKKITVYTPHTKITSVNVDGDKAVYYDENHALLNWEDRNDTKEAIAKAKKDAKQKIHKKQLLKTADKNLVKVLNNLLTFATKEGYTVDVKFK